VAVISGSARRANLGRKKISGERRAQIIEAFRRCAVRDGVWKTSIRDIAREAGVMPGIIHYYFKNREEMIELLVEDAADVHFRNFEEYISQFDDPVERIDKAIDFLFSTEVIDDETGRIFYDFWSLAKRNEKVRMSFVKVYGKFRKTIIDQIYASGTQHLFTDHEMNEIASMIIAIFEGVFLQWDLDWGNVNLTGMATLTKLMVDKYVQHKQELSADKKARKTRKK